MRRTLVVLLLVGSVTAEYNFMSDMIWGGPERGCASTEGAGQAVISCTLKSGNVTLNVDRAATWLKITCEEKSSFSCSELQESRPHVVEYITIESQTDRRISRLDVDSCVLPRERLACLLDLVNASSTELLRLIHCDGRLLDEHLDGMDAVKFRMNYIDKNTKSVPYSALSKLPSLRSFTMKGGSLVLERSNITLPNLRTLEIADGNLRVVPDEVFMNTPNIRTLMLWGNKISEIGEDAFKGLANLANISLNSNNISSLPPTLFSHSPLTRRIDLYHNRLEILQKNLFRGLQHLEEVIITSNSANLTLEDTFANLPSLRNLKLETSNIRRLPDNLLRNTTSLKTLSLGGNKLENLPPYIFSDLKLKSLNLYDNRITELPAMLLRNQTRLETLDLRRNSLKELPGGLFTDAASLKVLNLNDNQIEMLDRYAFNGAENLIELKLDGNGIRHISNATFDVVLSLETLSLARNNITIPQAWNTITIISKDEYYTSNVIKTYQYYSIFKSLTNLKRLNLSRNNVSIICEDWRQLIGLRNLDLSYNSIEYLSDVAMYFGLSDALIDVSHNKIKTIVPPIYQNADKPKFKLNGNPFKCDCYFYEFIQRSKTGNIPILDMDEAKCDTPSSLKNIRISELSPELLYCDVPCTNCTCKIIPYNRRFDLNCNELPQKLPEVPEIFEEMNVSNEIHLKAGTNFLPSYYRYVDLSNLNLTTAPSAESSMEINLINNSLEIAPVELLENNCTLYLSNNPLLCGCDDYDNVEVLKKYSHLILDFNRTVCKDGGLISNINIQQLCVARDAAIFGSTIAFFGIILAVFTAVAYKYSIEIRILLRKYNLWWGDEVDGDKEFDAFVSYSHQDENFVVDELIPKLEGGKPPLKLCVHYRNWVIGDFIPAQIVRSVEQSRKTIIVLSKHFINSIWGHIEFRTAHGKGKIIIIMLDDLTADEEKNLDPELKAYIAMNTYVKAKDPLVYDRIRDALLSKSENKLSTGLNVQLVDGKLLNVKKDVEIEIK